MKKIKEYIYKKYYQYYISVIEKEHLYNDIVIKYIYKKRKSNKLLIVFSAFSKKGQSARYNYIQHLNFARCNQLYILDNYGPDEGGSSYYLGHNKNRNIEDAVQNLIDSILKENVICKQDVGCVGSSKGGWSALYYAIKNNYGFVTVAAPQTLLGNFLLKSPEYFEYLAGEINRKNIEYLNKILYDLPNSKDTKILIQIGEGDPHYENHVIPFYNHVKTSANIKLDIQSYNSHGDAGKYFIPMLKEFVYKFCSDEENAV